MFPGRRIILGVTGSIAAYKSAFLTRLLVKSGAEVRVVMTSSAMEFVTPVTMATLSRNPVMSEFVAGSDGTWNSHVELGLWADFLVIAPASANTIAKMASGICDNLLMATYLSARCKVVVAPAMDLDMLQHPSTQENLRKLIRYGNLIIEPGYGELASGLTGSGRMAEPEEIVRFLEHIQESRGRLKGKKALVTAGPTHEAVDPVRFIGNHSTGKMGYAIAAILAEEGASVDLISGPANAQPPDHPNITLHRVTSAEEMKDVCQAKFSQSDIAVLAAAVADYRPATVARQKIKKADADIALQLMKTPDIAALLGKDKRPDQCLVGFALETEDELSNATKKLSSKNFDLIVLNSLNDRGAGFGYDTNKVTILEKNGHTTNYQLKLKEDVARDIVDQIVRKVFVS